MLEGSQPVSYLELVAGGLSETGGEVVAPSVDGWDSGYVVR